MGICVQSGIVEQFRSAVSPLTDTGRFRFETVNLDLYTGQLEFRLLSEQMIIIFYLGFSHKSATHGYCYRSFTFYLPSAMVFFSAEHLYPALKKIIPLRPKSAVGCIWEEESSGIFRARNLIDLLLEDNTLFSDISEACYLIVQDLEYFRLQFSPDKFDETLRLYTEETKKNRTYDGSLSSIDHSIRYDQSRCLQHTKIPKKYEATPRKDTGKLESILLAMELLRECFRDHISYTIATDRISILRHPDINKGWNGGFDLIFHTDDDGILRTYFIVTRPYAGLPIEKKPVSALLDYDKNLMVFSGETVFKILHLDYPSAHSDQLQELSNLSLSLQKSFPTINEAFSKEHIRDTYLKLQMTSKINEAAIIDVYKLLLWD